MLSTVKYEYDIVRILGEQSCILKQYFTGGKKDIDERSDEGVLLWLAHVERMERSMIA